MKSSILLIVGHFQVRDQVQERWMLGKLSVIVATISFGMGVDKPDVRYIY